MTAEHRFGGAWTEQKLQALAQYLSAYTTALKRQPFFLMYIDAFAGTGYRLDADTEDGTNLGLFEDARQYLAGSARIALETEPSFDRHVFIERRAAYITQIEALCREFPQKDTCVVPGEANQEIHRLCSTTDWRKWRAVLFLDPYGMQVEWKTLETIARTRAVDLWLLVPMGIAINRMLPNSGDIPPEWQQRLDMFFGAAEWREAAYITPAPDEPVQQTLFPEPGGIDRSRRAPLEQIERFLIKRLRDIFPTVLDPPLRLNNSHGAWLYSLFFAVASTNPRAQEIALRIAQHIITQSTR